MAQSTDCPVIIFLKDSNRSYGPSRPALEAHRVNYDLFFRWRIWKLRLDAISQLLLTTHSIYLS
jgi:hypothetical protein